MRLFFLSAHSQAIGLDPIVCVIVYVYKTSSSEVHYREVFRWFVMVLFDIVPRKKTL